MQQRTIRKHRVNDTKKVRVTDHKTPSVRQRLNGLLMLTLS